MFGALALALTPRLGIPAGALSGGEQQMIAADRDALEAAYLGAGATPAPA